MRFLFISKKYPPQPDPSGQIVSYLVQSLKNKGHFVDIIYHDAESQGFFTIDEKENHIKIKPGIWEVYQDMVNGSKTTKFIKIKYKVMQLIRKIILAFLIYKFPDSEPNVTSLIVKNFKMYLSTYSYDCIISFFRPYSCLKAGSNVLEFCKNTLFIPFFFDLVEDKDCPHYMPFLLYKYLIRKGNKKIFKKSYAVFLPLSAESTMPKEYQGFRDRFEYYEFPTFIKKNMVNGNMIKKHQSDIITFIFAGTLDSTFRNPIKLLQLLDKVAEKMDSIVLQLDIYGGGDCSECIKCFNHVANFIINQHARTDKTIIDTVTCQSDILINITNSYKTIVPSKIFELFATGKPILNIISDGDDGSLKYFKRYPLAFNAEFYDSNELQGIVSKVVEFIMNNKNTKVDINIIGKEFIRNTPDFVVDQILKAVTGQQKMLNKIQDK